MCGAQHGLSIRRGGRLAVRRGREPGHEIACAGRLRVIAPASRTVMTTEPVQLAAGKYRCEIDFGNEVTDEFELEVAA